MICKRCLTHNEKHELRGSKKLKGLSVESSRQLKCCKACDCRVFYRKEGK